MHIIVMNFILSLCLFWGLCPQKDHVQQKSKNKHSIKLITLLSILFYIFNNFYMQPIDSSPILSMTQK